MAISCSKHVWMVPLLVATLIFVSTPSIAESPNEKVTKEVLGKICSKAIYPDFCLHQLGSNPQTFTLDLHGLLGLSIDLAKSNSQQTLDMFYSLFKRTTKPALRNQYKACLGYYNQAISSLEQVEKRWSSRDYLSASHAASDAVEGPQSCEDQFEGPSEEPISVQQRNDMVEKFCFLVHDITKVLLS